jgi:hypothetical protein
MMIHRITPRIHTQPVAAAYGRGTYMSTLTPVTILLVTKIDFVPRILQTLWHQLRGDLGPGRESRNLAHPICSCRPWQI